MKQGYPEKLQQVKLGKHLIKVKHDTVKEIYILEHRIKNSNITHKKYIFNIEQSNDLEVIKNKFNAIINGIEKDKEIDLLGAKIKQSKWDKYAVSTFYK